MQFGLFVAPRSISPTFLDERLVDLDDELGIYECDRYSVSGSGW
jgi:hypothetical protein